MVIADEIQRVTDPEDKPTGVVVPIELWREWESERGTAYLPKSGTMRQRLMDASTGPGASRSRTVVRCLECDPSGFHDLA